MQKRPGWKLAEKRIRGAAQSVYRKGAVTNSGQKQTPVGGEQALVPSIRTKGEVPRISGSRSRAMVPQEPILVIAGEHSGDLLGGDIVHQLQLLGYLKFFGTGGSHMASRGVEIIEDVNSLTVVGYVEGLKNYRRLKKLAELLIELARERGVKQAILVDYPGFNLTFAAMLKAIGVQTIQVVGPQIWAWNYGRIRKIKKNIDLMLVLYEFEVKIYQSEGVAVEWIGHPIIRRIPDKLRKEKALAPFSGLTVGLLPGSRRSEVSRLLGVLLESAELLTKKYKKIRFLLPNVNPELEEYILSQLQPYSHLKIEYFSDMSLRVMKSSDLLLIASGTATLEGAYFRKPMVIVYRVGTLNFLLASLLVRIPFIGLPNILAGKEVALELLQSEVTAENIFQEACRIIDDKEYHRKIVRSLTDLRMRMGDGDPALYAARAIDRVIRPGGKKG